MCLRQQHWGCPPALLEGEKSKRFLYSVKPLALLGEEVAALGFEPVPEFLPPAKFKSDNKLVHRHRIATRLMILGIFKIHFLLNRRQYEPIFFRH